MLALLLALSLAGNFMPQANATLTGSNFVTEITTTPNWSQANYNFTLAETDSANNIFVMVANDVWKSSDSGLTWTKVLDGDTPTTMNYLLFIDSNDNIYVMIKKTTFNLYRSTNHGLNWTAIHTSVPILWHMCEDSLGNLYVNTYSGTNKTLWFSTNEGVSFTVWHTDNDITHWHGIGVAPNNWVYALAGDSANAKVVRYNGTTWETVASGASAQFVGVWFDNTYVYFGNDGGTTTHVIRMPITGNWAQREDVLNPNKFMNTGGTVNDVWDGERYYDIMLFTTVRGQVWGSWDGERWVKVWQANTEPNRIIQISSRRPIYFGNERTGKLYRVDIQKEDLIQLFYQKYNSKKGLVTNSENYVLEQRISNGTNYLDLTNVALSNVQASIKGLTQTNEVLDVTKTPNAGFEWGNATGWTVITGGGSYSITTADKANGTYSIKFITLKTDYDHSRIQEPTGITYPTITKGDTLIASAYVKGNITSSQRCCLNWLNATSGTNLLTVYFDLTTSWQRVTAFYSLSRTQSRTPTPIRIEFYSRVLASETYESYWDSVLYEKRQLDLLYPDSANNDEVSYSNCLPNPKPFHTADILTTNPSILINGQTVSYSGTLTNGTASTPQSLTGILTGAVKVDANIQGSGQAILCLTGTRIFNTANVILKGYTDGWYYGRYYGTPTYPTEPYALTNLQANITSLSTTTNTLTLTIDSPSGTTSNTKVYVGDKGQPKTVTGAVFLEL